MQERHAPADLSDVLFGMRHPSFHRKLGQQCRGPRRPADSPRQHAGKWIEGRTNSSSRGSQFHVVAILHEVQGTFAAVAFHADGHELVAGRSLRRIDPKGVLGRAQIVDVERQLTIPGFEILMQQTLKVVQQIDIRPAIDVLVQSVRLVKGGSLFADYTRGQRISCETLQPLLEPSALCASMLIPALASAKIASIPKPAGRFGEKNLSSHTHHSWLAERIANKPLFRMLGIQNPACYDHDHAKM